jgi:hypothetical protein
LTKKLRFGQPGSGRGARSLLSMAKLWSPLVAK